MSFLKTGSTGFVLVKPQGGRREKPLARINTPCIKENVGARQPVKLTFVNIFLSARRSGHIYDRHVFLSRDSFVQRTKLLG